MSASPQTSALLRAFADIIRPAPRLGVDEWADEHRMLDTTSALPGKWRTDNAPFAREPMQVLSGYHPCQRVVLMWASQLSKSEIINNWLGRTIHLEPAPTMLVQPTVDTVKDYNKQRLRPMFRSSPALRSRVKEPKSRNSESTLSHIAFPGGFVRLSGANSSASLASTPICNLALDEVDRYPHNVDGEGDPVELAIQRTSTFEARRKILLTSTPTITGSSRIAKAYEESDQRRYYVPCPDCDEYQVLQWGNVEYEKDADGHVIGAEYCCEHCGCLIDHSRKGWMLERGEWRAENPSSPIPGFHLSALYAAPGLGPTWAALADQWVRAQGDPEQLQAFINLRLGETFDPSGGDAFDQSELMKRREVLGKTLPDGVKIITAGLDVQGDRIELQTVGWGEQHESWILDYRVFHAGDTANLDDDAWQLVAEALEEVYPRSDGTTLGITAAGLDANYNTDAVCDFCKPRTRHRIWPVMGSNRDDKPVWPRKASMRRGRTDVKLYRVGVHQAKIHVYGRLETREPGPGYIHLPQRFWSGEECGLDWLKQLTAETLRVKKGKRGKREWYCPPGRRNEALDTYVYAYASLVGWARSKSMPLEQAIRRRAAALARRAGDAEQDDKPKQRTERSGGGRRRRTGWLNRPAGKRWL